MYSHNGLDGTIIDTATNAVTATLRISSLGTLNAVAINPAGARAHYTDWFRNSVCALDAATNTVIASILVGAGPAGIDATPDGAFIHVANYDGASVSVIDAETNEVAATVPIGVGSSPYAFGEFIGGGAAPPPSGNVVVPTLSRWKLLLLAALLGGAAMHALATVMENSARTTIRRLPPAGGTASGEVPCPARVRGRWADRSPSPSAACTRRTTRRCPPESPATRTAPASDREPRSRYARSGYTDFTSQLCA